MALDPKKYQGLIKLLAIIPFTWGLLTFVEVVMDTKTEPNQVFSKSENFRIKTQKTTYTIDFKNINDQFTKDIYDQLSRTDSVMLELTPIHRQIVSVTPFSTGIKLVNDTNEFFAILIFGAAFILSGLVWFKKDPLSKRQFNMVGLTIIFSIISIVRIFV